MRQDRRRNKNTTSDSKLVTVEKAQSRTLRRLEHLSELQYDGVLPRTPDQMPVYLQPRQIYQFDRSYDGGLLAASTTTAVFGAYNFVLSAFAGSTDFTSLFDSYRFRQIEVSFVPTNPDLIAASLYSVIDYDDSNVPASIAELLQYPSLQMTMSNQITKRVFQPRAAAAAYSGTFTSYAQTAANQWFDCDSPNIQHYGVKYWLPALASATATANIYQVLVRAIIQFKNPR